MHTDDHQGEAELLAVFGTGRDHLLGAGGESEVFAIDHERVLRLYRSRHEAPRRTATQLDALYQTWAGSDIGLELPMILDMGERNGRFFTVDRRLSGRNFSGWLQHADMAERRPALISFLDATERLQRLPSPVPGFARLIGEGAPQQFSTLAELLSQHAPGAAPEQPDATGTRHSGRGRGLEPTARRAGTAVRRSCDWCTVMSARPTRTSARVPRDRLLPESLISVHIRCTPTR